MSILFTDFYITYFFQPSVNMKIMAKRISNPGNDIFEAGESQKIHVDISPVMPGNYRLLVKYTVENERQEIAGEVLLTVE